MSNENSSKERTLPCHENSSKGRTLLAMKIQVEKELYLP
jgi:hypothetical protein